MTACKGKVRRCCCSCRSSTREPCFRCRWPLSPHCCPARRRGPSPVKFAVLSCAIPSPCACEGHSVMCTRFPAFRRPPLIIVAPPRTGTHFVGGPGWHVAHPQPSPLLGAAIHLLSRVYLCCPLVSKPPCFFHHQCCACCSAYFQCLLHSILFGCIDTARVLCFNVYRQGAERAAHLYTSLCFWTLYHAHRTARILIEFCALHACQTGTASYVKYMKRGEEESLA